MRRTPLTDDDKHEIHRLYIEHGSIKKVRLFTGRSAEAVIKTLYERGVTINGPGAHSKKELREGAFNTLTRESAYYLGLAITDGHIAAKGAGNGVQFSFGLKTSDRALVVQFRDWLCPEQSIIEDRTIVKFVVNDSPTCLDLAQWGYRWRRKTYELGSCDELLATLVAGNLLWHFIRGVIDGNGTIGVYGVKGCNSVISICGTRRFLRSIKSHITDLTGSEGSLRHASPSINPNETESGWELRYTGLPQLIRLGKCIYLDSDGLRLARKYETYYGVIKARELLETPAK